MTTVYANNALDLSSLDLGALAAGSVSFQDNVNFTSALGRVYEDVLRVSVATDPPVRTEFMGAGIIASPSAGITGGTIQGIQHDVWNGSAWTAAWGMEGFSASAVALYDAAKTPDTTDDLAFLTSALAGADTFTLSNQADDVRGFAGNDQVDGRGGNDSLDGGDGNDTLLGGDGNDDLYGGAGNDSIVGGAGNDWIVGEAGADTLVGGAGNDTFFVGSDDVVVETSTLAGEVDMVRSSVDWTLGANLEYLVLDGEAVRGTGNGLANQIIGNAAANLLSGLGGDDGLRGSLGNDTLNGGTGNDTLLGGEGNDRMAGGPGDDRYEVDSAGDRVVEDLAAGGGIDLVTAGISYTLPVNVEDLVLSGTGAIDGSGNELANHLVGNSAANTLTGLDGNDTLDGGGGANTLDGGRGDDVYVVRTLHDQVSEAAAAGSDLVQAWISYTLRANVEQLTLLGSTAIDGYGNPLANTITGNAAANLLDGRAGADTLAGGAGDDHYVVDDPGDVVIEAAASGNDLVTSSIGYTLTPNVEQLVLTGGAAIDGSGNALANTITGNVAANRLDGGAGADTLAGGAGNDTYVVDNPGDVVTEAAASGTDTVLAGLSFVLPDNVERLTLTGTAAINGSGNTLANLLLGNAAGNHLTGGAGDDTLDGAGGADTLAGGTGNDRYVVDNPGDRVVESAASGIDRVSSSIGYTLTANVEGLTLTGSAAIDGNGNGLANTLTGNAAANQLNGAGGADTLAGGAGNDTYVVDEAGDVVVEAPGGGTDTVRASLSWTLGANLERLVLTGSTAGLVGVGNDANNLLVGNGATNQLQGLGGDDTLRGGGGSDALIGGSGNDAFRFDTAPDSASGADVIYDFTPGEDRIELAATVFSALGPTGPLAAGSFTVGSAAADADDRIIYDAASGTLFYDPDGSGDIEAVAFARESGPIVTFSAGDFWIV